MKKLLMMVLALMLAFSVSAFAAEEEEMCPTCDKSKCTVPTLCQEDQEVCTSAQPCNILINICNCGDGTFWKDNDQVGIRATSLTEGVYFTTEGNISVRLFRNKTTGSVSTTGENYKEAWLGDMYNDGVTAGENFWGQVPSISSTVADTDTVKFYAFGACDFLSGELDADKTIDGVTDANIYEPTSRINFEWAASTDIDYFDTDGDLIVSPGSSYSSCTVGSTSKIDMVQTQKSTPWILDVDDTDNSAIDPDNDGDGSIGEDKGDYLMVRIPSVVVDWAEVEAAGLKGTTAQAKICILDVEGATSGLCTDCAIICCCTIDTVKLCPASRDKCIYYPYALYGQTESGWSTGIVVSNISLDNSVLSGTQVTIADMSVDFTIIDQTGAVFTGTYASFTKAVQSFTVDGLIDNMLGLTGVAPGNVYIKIEANFDIDGYEFNLLNNGSLSFGAGVLPRSCAWPSADVFVDQYETSIKSLWATDAN